ncbi:MAG: hypothetical protein ACYDHO_08780 [Gaiellaceae bacterium]
MLVALTAKSIAEVLLSIALLPFLVGYLIRRRRRIQPSWLTVRGGRVALNDKGRAKVGGRGLDISRVEASIAETFALDDEGDIVLSEAGREALSGGAEEKR